MASYENKEPLRVLVTGAAGQIGYSLLPLLASGQVFGPTQPIILHLLDITQVKQKLDGVAMELEDCSYPLVKGIVVTTELKEAFTGVNYAILLGGFPRGPGMERRDLMAKNVPIFVGQGKALNEYAAPGVKVLVVANPANTNCLILAQNAPNIPKTSFAAMTRLDQNRSVYQIAKKLSVDVTQVHNVIVWGNHSKTMFPDVANAKVTRGGTKEPLANAVDEKWLTGEFMPLIQNRGAEIMKARGSSSAMSAANASADHMRNWHMGTATGEVVSFGVWTDGTHYGVPEGLVFSMPVKVVHGEYQIVDGLDVASPLARRAFEATTNELIAERQEAADALKPKAT